METHNGQWTERFDINGESYRVPSVRATWHNYTAGMYFVTIATRDHRHYFGTIHETKTTTTTPTLEMCLSPIGRILKRVIDETPDHYRNAEIPMHVIMPNHVHLVIALHETSDTAHPKTLGNVVGSIKAAVTRAANVRHIPFGWQARYYDRIIRNNEEMNEIATYIQHNVAKWAMDKIAPTV